jgi:hypothetical protein
MTSTKVLFCLKNVITPNFSTLNGFNVTPFSKFYMTIRSLLLIVGKLKIERCGGLLEA